MRWLFLFVFALNLAYIAWGISQPPADPYANVRPLKNVETIVLLSEVKSADGTLTDKRKAERVEVVAQEAAERSEQRSVADAVEVSDASSAPVKEDIVIAETVAGVVSVETPVELALAEPEETRPEKKLPAEKSEPAAIMPAQDSTACYTLGPFRDLKKLRRLTRDIKSYVVSADFRGNEEKEQSLYWVYIKPEKNRKAAIATGKRLKAKKIKDFYVIREGDKINGLSLGYFRSKDGATGLVKKVDRLGFDVVLEPVYKTYTVYWLDYQLAEGAKVPKTVFDKYTGSAKKDKVKLTGRDCDS